MSSLIYESADRIPLHADVQRLIAEEFCFEEFCNGEQGYVVYDNGSRKVAVDGDNANESFSGYVQRWLFFGLLIEIFRELFVGTHEIVELYCKRDGFREAWRVDMSPLLDHVERWQDWECSNPRGRTARLIHKENVLSTARHVVSHYCAVSYRYLEQTTSDSPDEPKWQDVNGHIVLSIMVLGQTLSRAMSRVQGSTGLTLKHWRMNGQGRDGWGYSSIVVDELLMQNWCSHALQDLFALFCGNTIGLWYISKLVHPPELRMRLRGTCNRSNTCEAFPHSATMGKLAHSPSCKHVDSRLCTSRVGPDRRKLLDILKSGKTPLLELHPHEVADEDKVQVIGVDLTTGLDYAVLSHVFSEQIGSHHNNQMNLCILDWLCHILNRIGRRQGSQGPQRFWIDVLCIPVITDMESLRCRERAKGGMHEVYIHGRFTVVLDSWLTHLTAEDFISVAIHLIVCKWMTRLWTLQEGFISKEVYLELNHDCISLDELEKRLVREDRLSPSCVASTARICHEVRLGQARTQVCKLGSSAQTPDPSFVGLVWKAARWRTTTWPHHEALVFARLLNLPTDEFIHVESWKGKTWTAAELMARMKRLIDLLSAARPCAIPPGMIFLPGQRLDIDGYRWAPRTWMQPSYTDPPDPIMILRASTRLNPPYRLEVHFPGFKLYNLGEDCNSSGLTEIIFTPETLLFEWYSVTKADTQDNNLLSSSASTSPEESRTPRQSDNARQRAVIVPQYPLIHPQEIALLVEIDEERDGILYAKIISRVWLRRELDQHQINRWRTRFRRRDFDGLSWGERVPDDQRWCVDGRKSNSQTATSR